MSYHDLNSGLIVNSQRNMLNEENTVTDALKWMEAEEVEHLIVISGQYFNKLISIEDLENQKKFETLKHINLQTGQIILDLFITMTALRLKCVTTKFLCLILMIRQS